MKKEGQAMYDQEDDEDLKAQLTKMIHDIVDQRFDYFGTIQPTPPDPPVS